MRAIPHRRNKTTANVITMETYIGMMNNTILYIIRYNTIGHKVRSKTDRQS